jgi:hypothetical protein
MIGLTKQRGIAPYVWVRPDGEREAAGSRRRVSHGNQRYETCMAPMVSAGKQIGGFAPSEFNVAPLSIIQLGGVFAPRTLGGIAAKLGLQLYQINEDVGLAS